jgi:hypothetical protein
MTAPSGATGTGATPPKTEEPKKQASFSFEDVKF